jgi:Mg2+ and Co2+ transporter CorA
MANALLEQYTESYEDDLRRIKSRVDEIEARIQELKKSLSDYNHSMYSDLTIFDDVIRFRVDASEK